MTLRLTGPHIQATGYRRGRDRKRWPENKITYLVLHTAEGATDEVDLGHFFQRLGTASSSAGIGQDGGYASYVRYRDTPWTNPPIHDDTETLEICGFAGWSRATWLQHDKMLETVAHWIAWRSAANGIPIRRIEGERLRNGVKGIVDHDGINDVFHESTHWDIGENFPWDIVLPRARQIRKNRGPREEDDMPTPEDLWKKYQIPKTEHFQHEWSPQTHIRNQSVLMRVMIRLLRRTLKQAIEDRVAKSAPERKEHQEILNELDEVEELLRAQEAEES